MRRCGQVAVLALVPDVHLVRWQPVRAVKVLRVGLKARDNGRERRNFVERQDISREPGHTAVAGICHIVGVESNVPQARNARARDATNGAFLARESVAGKSAPKLW